MRLARSERRALDAILEAILPGEVSGDVSMQKFQKEVLARAPLRFVVGIRLAVLVVSFAPIVVLRRPTTFTRLAPGDRARVLEAFRTSSSYLVRELLVLLKSLACLGWCGLERGRALTGVREPDARGAEGGASGMRASP